VVEILKKVWKMYRKSILSSLLVVLAIAILIYLSSIQGRFIWISQPTAAGYAVLLEVSALAIGLSFLALLILFVLFFVRTRKAQ